MNDQPDHRSDFLEDDAELSSTPSRPNTPKKPTSKLSPAFQIFGFLMLVLLSVLIFRSLITDNPSSDTKSSDRSFGNEHNRQRRALGMEPRDDLSEVESVENISARLTSDAKTLAALVDSMHQLLDKKETQLQEAQAEAIAAMKGQRQLRQQLEQTQQQLDHQAASAQQVSSLRAELEAARRHNQALTRQIETLESAPKTSPEELTALRSERDEFAARVNQLETKTQTLMQALEEAEAAKTTSEAEAETTTPPQPEANPEPHVEAIAPDSDSTLGPEATALVRALKDLEEASSEELARAYGQFNTDLGANVLQTCRFDASSAEISIGLEEQLRDLPSEAPEGALLLVVGYHSQPSDDSAPTEKLAHERLAAVTKMLDSAKRANQSVHAIHLGETNRFSKRNPATNDRVEVWRVIKKSSQ